MPATTSPAIAAVSPESGSVDQCKPAAASPADDWIAAMVTSFDLP
jgi:hypothetical protein